MLSTKLLKEYAAKSMDLKTVELEAIEGETVNIKKFTMGDTMSFRDLSEDEMVCKMVQLAVVDEKGKPLFPTDEAVAEMPVELITELVEHVTFHNSGADMETQAKKS